MVLFKKALMLSFMASRNGTDNILCALDELCVESALADLAVSTHYFDDPQNWSETMLFEISKSLAEVEAMLKTEMLQPGED
jgi:hypothetical protein